jgi:hypothetical protein
MGKGMAKEKYLNRAAKSIQIQSSWSKDLIR